MTARKLRAALTAILLGSATAGATALVMTAPAQAATVSARVGALLKEAQSLMAAKNYKAAQAKVAEADAAKSSADDAAIINQFKNAIAAASADTSTAVGAKAKFAQDYNARRYKDVIADADALKKFNALDASSMQIVAQAYYLSGDHAGCQRYIKSNFSSPSTTTLRLLVRCAYEAGDEATQRQALETLVARGGSNEDWKGLLRLAERSRGLNDHNTLDVNRMRMLTGNITTKDDYTLLAQIALQLGNAAEAQSVIEKGMAAKVLNDDRSTRLLNLAKTQAAAAVTNQAKNLAAAQASPQGDDLVKLGENMLGQPGKAKDAIAIIQQGLKKPLKDAANGQIRLGHAYLVAGQKADAAKAFASVKAPEKDAMIAHLWTLVARR